MPWDPGQYLGFARERARPAVDLLARVDLAAPRDLLDLGCGAGNITRLLAERWPGAEVTGVDASPEMLARARQALPGAAWVAADLRTWEPPGPVDLVFSNAALHWLPDHPALFPRLLSWLRPGGVLAVQMPASFHHPSHRAAADLLAEAPWRGLLLAPVAPSGVHPLADYHAWLAPRARDLDLWDTTYLHRLRGEDPVTEWFKGSLLVPCLEALPPARHGDFLEAYGHRVRAAYPRDASGTTLLPFQRRFLVATA